MGRLCSPERWRRQLAGVHPANQPIPLQGLYERIDIGADLLWIALLAAALPAAATAGATAQV